MARPRARRAMIRRGVIGGALLVAALVSLKLYLRTSSRDQHTLRFQHTTDGVAADSVVSGSAAAGSTISKGSTGSVANEATSQTGSRQTHNGDCHAEAHAEYDGTLVKWGSQHLQDTADACCQACRGEAKCNVWVWCGDPAGCAAGRTHKECWLKSLANLNVDRPAGGRGEAVKWTSGALYTAKEAADFRGKVAAAAMTEEQRLAALRADERLPLVYLDVTIKGKPIGRMEFVLFSDVAPRCAENYRQLCTGESGIVPVDDKQREGAGKARHFKGAYFYRIIDRFIDQSGVDTESVFGGQFKDDPGGTALVHDRKGLLSMANMGPNTNTAHFSIMQAPAPHLNGAYTIFGELVSGWEVAEAINALSRLPGKTDNTAGREEEALIADSGQIRKGTLEPKLEL